MPVNNHHLSLFHLLKFGQPLITKAEQNEGWDEQFYDFVNQAIQSNLINFDQEVETAVENLNISTSIITVKEVSVT